MLNRTCAYSCNVHYSNAIPQSFLWLNTAVVCDNLSEQSVLALIVEMQEPSLMSAQQQQTVAAGLHTVQKGT